MTIDELQALPDKELNALAAKLRGLKTFNFQGVKWLGVTDVSASHEQCEKSFLLKRQVLRPMLAA